MKPIIFSTAEVNEILNGNKVQFRKPIKPQPRQPIPLGFISDSTDIKRIGCYGWGVDELGGVLSIAKPPYKIRDILYVKESWRYGSGRGTSTYQYKTDMTEKELEEEREEYEPGVLKWKSPVTMPKEAARYFLKIKDVKVQKLQDMQGEDFELEMGINEVDSPCNSCKGNTDSGCSGYCKLEVEFSYTWDKKYKKKGYGWDRKHWTWVFEFEIADKE